MNYKELLKSKGWVSSPGCATCGGVQKQNWTHPDKPGVVIEDLYTRQLYRYKVNGRVLSGGTVGSLEHQHFMQ